MLICHVCHCHKPPSFGKTSVICPACHCHKPLSLENIVLVAGWCFFAFTNRFGGVCLISVNICPACHCHKPLSLWEIFHRIYLKRFDSLITQNGLFAHGVPTTVRLLSQHLDQYQSRLSLSQAPLSFGKNIGYSKSESLF